jgi:hypothetical protein
MGRRPAGGVAALRYRRALVRTAVSAAAAGWPIVPGAWWSGADRRFVCDLTGCGRTGPHPAVGAQGPGVPEYGEPVYGDGLADQALRHPEAVAARWRQRPYAVLVPTGEACDVVDVPAATGRVLAMRLDARSSLGPVIAAGTRWFLLTAPGGTRHATLDGDVLLHGEGSWIMLPPSLGPGGEPATWLARPRGTGWTLPARDVVLTLLNDLSPAERRGGGAPIRV